MAQCNDWIGRNLPNAERIAVASNAEAARLVAESDSPNVTAIAGRIAAKFIVELCRRVYRRRAEQHHTLLGDGPSRNRPQWQRQNLFSRIRA